MQRRILRKVIECGVQSLDGKVPFRSIGKISDTRKEANGIYAVKQRCGERCLWGLHCGQGVSPDQDPRPPQL